MSKVKSNPDFWFKDLTILIVIYFENFIKFPGIRKRFEINVYLKKYT